MKKLKAALVKSLAGTAGFEKIKGDSTLHHKISRDALGRMLKALKATPSDTEGVAEMWAFIKSVESLTEQEGEEALDNWATNIELGVIATARAEKDDPGAGFDGNYPAGIATPRTEQLAEAALIIDAIPKDGPARAVDWASLAGYLSQAQRLHEQDNDAGALSEPDLTQWTKLQNGRYVRDKRKALTTSSV
jgi:hypothetical protein